MKNLANFASGYLGYPHPGRQGEAARCKSCSVTYKELFQHFYTGMEWQMGKVEFQNKALTHKMVVGLGNLLGKIWESTAEKVVRESAEELM